MARGLLTRPAGPRIGISIDGVGAIGTTMTSQDAQTRWSWAATAKSAAGELLALAQVVASLPLRTLGADTLAESGDHPVPVVLVHGIMGDPTNFAVLRRHLFRHGIRRFSSFAYRPRLDYQRI